MLNQSNPPCRGTSGRLQEAVRGIAAAGGEAIAVAADVGSEAAVEELG